MVRRSWLRQVSSHLKPEQCLIVCYLKSTNLENIAQLSNTTVIGISESKLDDSVLSSEIHIDNCNTLHCDQNRHVGGVVFHISNDLSFDVKPFFLPEIEKVRNITTKYETNSCRNYLSTT